MNVELQLTGIPIIDQQHKKYEILVEEFQRETAATQIGRVELDGWLKKILAYVMEHFDTEELLMRSEGYPRLEEHVQKHNEFRRQADDFIAELATAVDLDDYVNRLSAVLTEWFRHQVLEDDVKLAKFLQAKKA